MESGNLGTNEWKSIGDSLFKLMKYKEAIAAYDQALRVDPKNAFALNNKGVALAKLGDYQQALATLMAATQINPDCVNILENKENILHDFMPKKGPDFKIPDGLHRCEICGEYNGKVKRKELNWATSFSILMAEYQDSEEYITVSCLCKGPLCRRCGKNRIHRPVSNSYEEKTNTFGYWPWLTGLMPCSEFRKKEEQEKKSRALEELAKQKRIKRIKGIMGAVLNMPKK